MVCCSVLLVVLVSFYFLQSRPVYLVDFYCYRAPDRCVCSQHRLPNRAGRCRDRQQQWGLHPPDRAASRAAAQPMQQVAGLTRPEAPTAAATAAGQPWSWLCAQRGSSSRRHRGFGIILHALTLPQQQLRTTVGGSSSCALQ